MFSAKNPINTNMEWKYYNQYDLQIGGEVSIPQTAEEFYIRVGRFDRNSFVIFYIPVKIDGYINNNGYYYDSANYCLASIKLSNNKLILDNYKLVSGGEIYNACTIQFFYR